MGNYFLFSLALAVMFYAIAAVKSYKLFNSLVAILVFVSTGIFNILYMPVINFARCHVVWIEITAVFILAFLYYKKLHNKEYHREDEPEVIELPSNLEFEEKKSNWGLRFRAIPMVLCLIAFIVMAVRTLPFLHRADYRNLLQVEKVEVELAPNAGCTLNIDKEKAIKIANSKLAVLLQLGRCTVGEMELQALTCHFVLDAVEEVEFDGELAWVAPVKGSNDAYVIVSAETPKKSYVVQNHDGKNIHIEVANNMLLDNVEALVKNNGYIGCELGRFSFKIDQKGSPYWVAPVYERKVGFSGRDVKTVVIVDAQTEVISEYTLNSVPSWVDMVQPKEIIEEQIDDWLYDSGFSADELKNVYDANKGYWCVKISDAGESVRAFMLIDGISKEAKFYVCDPEGEQHPLAATSDDEQSPSRSVGYQTTVSAEQQVQLAMKNAVGQDYPRRKARVLNITWEGKICSVIFREYPDVEFIGTSEYFLDMKWATPDHKISFSCEIDPDEAPYYRGTNRKRIAFTFFEDLSSRDNIY